jgi:hypothetical protein
MSKTRVVVVGAGAAGTMAAISAASAGAETLLLERTKDGGRKILISGGGRCNILPAHLDETRFVTGSSTNTLRKIVRSWPLREQIAFFEDEVELPLKEEANSGKLFPASNRARDVRDRLIALGEIRGVRMVPDTLVTSLARAGRSWRVATAGSEPIEADTVIIATGGRSLPETGSDGRGLAILEALGHTIHPTYPALTPLTVEPCPFAALAGISLEVSISARSEAPGETRSATASGGFLFTHHGYSGPAVLDVSHVAVRSLSSGGPPACVLVRWTRLDEKGWEEKLQAHGTRTVAGVLRRELPDRLAAALLALAGVEPTRSLAQLKREDRRLLTETLVRFELPWTGHPGYRKAEVTGGGVSLAEINPKTMESRLHPGLFLCGELLDGFGPIGGYNFLWAWVTGRAAGLGAARTT